MATSQNPDVKTTRITLCGAQGCCPTVEINHASNKIVITDDDGGKVTLTKEQWQDALTKVVVGV